MQNQFALLKTRRFWPLFVTQMLGALNDNLFKTAASVLIAYGLWETGGTRPEILVSAAAGVFILPFVLFTPAAGILADKYDKARMMRILKLAEIGIVLGAALAILIKSTALGLFIVFLLGVQSAFFNPCKFAILPEQLEKDELIGGNALANTGTYLSILGGTILGGLLSLSKAGLIGIILILGVCAVTGYATSRLIPPAKPPAPDLKPVLNSFAEAFRSLRYIYGLKNEIWRAALGTGWFYFTGALMIAQFPSYTSLILRTDNIVLTFFMTLFSVGIALGGLLNNRLLKSKIDARYATPAALLMGLLALDLYFASAPVTSENLRSLSAFLSGPQGLRISFDLLVLSSFGGLYVVPLQSLIQHKAPRSHVARVQAASAFVNAIFILLSAVAALMILGAGFAVRDLFLLVSAGSLTASFFMRRL